MLSVTVKTVKQQTIKIEIEGTATSLDLKGKIQETLGVEYPAENQKLIFKGKILKDTEIIQEMGLNEASFIVVMVSKPKPSPVPAPAPELAPAPQVSPPSPAAPSEDVAAPPDPPQGASSAPQQSAEEMIDNLMELTGNSIPRSHVEEVLTRCENKLEIAAAILTGGEELFMPTEGGVMGPPQAQGVTPAAQDNTLEFLRSQPQFQQLRNVLQTNPQALHQILAQIEETNPQLFQLIHQNEAQFRELINSPDSGPSHAPTGQPTVGQAPPAGAGGQSTLTVTSSEKEAIDRLKALGFPEQMAIQAYFAFDKNEELAANFLLSDQ
ncbi:hypothetical protein LOD99_9290 [Oopsacas minuta]|uniref:UV excision repair protein RAD23 n=1 Tax=Oopsacas minuta TaxID=111878 RepID=A0AAV7JC62_9METZ|nr:hypothetical protein LOD99_9290 [Oopsacas minuta]